jgi:hypothetical protein
MRATCEGFAAAEVVQEEGGNRIEKSKKKKQIKKLSGDRYVCGYIKGLTFLDPSSGRDGEIDSQEKWPNQI